MPPFPYLLRCGLRARPLHGERVAITAALFAIVAAVVGGLAEGSHVVLITIVVGTVLVLAALWPVPVRIGSDGLVLNGFGSRFVPFAEIDLIDETAEGVVLRCRDGRKICLVDHVQRKPDATATQELRALVLSCWRRRVELIVPPRGRETVGEWIEATRRHLGALHPARREEQLIAAVEDPAQPALHRAAFALLLRDCMTTDQRQRIGRVAMMTACDALARTLNLLCAYGSPWTDLLATLERFPRPVVSPATRARAVVERWLRDRHLPLSLPEPKTRVLHAASVRGRRATSPTLVGG